MKLHVTLIHWSLSHLFDSPFVTPAGGLKALIGEAKQYYKIPFGNDKREQGQRTGEHSHYLKQCRRQILPPLKLKLIKQATPSIQSPQNLFVAASRAFVVTIKNESRRKNPAALLTNPLNSQLTQK